FVNVSRLLPSAHRRLAMVFRTREDITPAVDVFMNYIRSYSEQVMEERRHEHSLEERKLSFQRTPAQ
ncbi:MAG: hypothetical protein M1596_04535, partial [Firmicutes bacterium]|nr:hypothetical protein [Bacillota bacterium]